MQVHWKPTLAVLVAVVSITATVKFVAAQDAPVSVGFDAAAEKQPSRPIADVVLQPGGVLLGRVLDRDGTPLDGARVVVRQAERIEAALISDTKGEFSVGSFGPGVYRIDTPLSTRQYRLWRPEDAPPSAMPVALLVSQEPMVRGQFGYVTTTELLSLGLGAAGVTLGVIALERAEDADQRAKRAQTGSQNNANTVTGASFGNGSTTNSSGSGTTTDSAGGDDSSSPTPVSP